MSNITPLWSELTQRVRRFVGARVNDAHAADDVTQDIMLKLQMHVAAIGDNAKLPAWVFAVARNAIVDHYRSAAVAASRGGANVGTDGRLAEFSATEEQDALRELMPCLARMVEHLPEPYRQAMQLVDFQGLSQQALADRTGISLSGAKSRVQRARQMLREMIHDCCQVEQDGRGNVIDFERTERSARYCGTADGTPRCDR